MEPRATLWLDILAYIIDILAAGDDGDAKSLQMLSRTCKDMVPLCRRHLFSSLKIQSKSDALRFGAVLGRNPSVARYVTSLKYSVYNPINDHELKILDSLKEHSSLKSITLQSDPGFDWNDLPGSIQSSLIFLIQLNSVTQLKIYIFRNFPSTALALCSKLVDLRLEELEVAPPDINQVISRTDIPAPTTLQAKLKTYNALAVLITSPSALAGIPLVNFSRLQKATFDVDSPSDIDHIGQLLKTTTQLYTLKITLDWPVELAGLGASLAVNAYRTLRSVVLNITVVGDNYDPLCGLSDELRFLSGNNILQEFELDVVVRPDELCRPETEDWAALDSLLTEPGGFPMLRRVSIEIVWCSFGRDESAVDDILDSLTEEQFPRLVESTVVTFEFSAENQDI